MENNRSSGILSIGKRSEISCTLAIVHYVLIQCWSRKANTRRKVTKNNIIEDSMEDKTVTKIRSSTKRNPVGLEYREYLHQIAKKLTKGDVEKLKLLLGRNMPARIVEKLTSAEECFQVMERQDLLAENEFEHLKEYIKEIDRDDLYKELQALCEHQKQLKANPYRCNLVKYFYKTKDADRLRDLLQSKDVAILHGMPGCGKSQLASWYAKEFITSNKDLSKDDEFPAWVFPCQTESNLVTSMKTMLNCLNFQSSQTFGGRELAHEICSLLLSDRTPNVHVLIFDDVDSDCCELIEEIMYHISNKDGGDHPNLTLKIIITTNNENLSICHESNKIHIQGMTEDEVFDFFMQNNHELSTDDLQQFQLKLGFLPLGMKTARSYMYQTSISATEFLKLLDDKAFNGEHDSKSKTFYQKGLYGAIHLALRKLRLRLSEEAYSIFSYLPFLEYDNIPIFLLKALLHDTMAKKSIDAELGQFIEGLKCYSLGFVQGLDDGRTISFHAVTIKAITLLQNDIDQKSKLKKILNISVSHIDIGVRRYSKLHTNTQILPHAIKLLKDLSKEKFYNEIQLKLSACYVYCAVGATIRLRGLDDEQANEYQAKALGLIEDISKHEFHLNVVEDHSIKAKAKEMYEVLSETGKKFIEETVVQDFLMSKVRILDDIDYYCKRGGFEMADFPNNKLRGITHQRLCEQKLATPISHLRMYFLIELILYILYNTSRNLYRLRKLEKSKKTSELASVEERNDEVVYEMKENSARMPGDISIETKGLADRDLHYVIILKLANGLCGLLPDEFKPYITDIIKRNVPLYSLLRNASNDKSGGERNMKNAIENCDEMSQNKGDYFGFGVVIMGEGYNYYNQTICNKHKLKYYQYLFQLEDNFWKRRDLFREAMPCLKKMKNTLENQEMLIDFQASSSFYIQMAKFLKLSPLENKMEDIERARKYLDKAEEIEKNSEANVRSHYMRQIKINQIECFSKLKGEENQKKAKELCDNFLKDLEGTSCEKHIEKAKHFQKILTENLPTVTNI